jgi:serine/threonine protein kinase
MHSTRAAPGAVIGGRYALRTAIGHGGMGTVWRASDTILRREVAVKEVVLPPGLATSDAEAMYERTFREARAAASLSHPSVVQVFDVVTEDGRPWIVMELLDARSLADMVIDDGPLAPRAVAKIGIALLGALEVAHAGGVLHRDVKPANVLITRDGRCVLTDFGVAKLPADVQLTTPGMVLGSPHFISPERALGHRFGPPSDLFSLGVTLYTAVEGRPPFDKGDPLATMHSVVEDQPEPPVRCGPLIDVLYGLMEKDPARRWDVARSRGFLRELLAGPLAQSASPQHVTDPWAVVAPAPPQAYEAYQPPAAPAKPQKQVGGRAMLNTGELPGARRGQPTRQEKARQNTNRHESLRNETAAQPILTEKPNNRMRLAVAGGVAAVLLVISLSWVVFGGDGDADTPGDNNNANPGSSQAPANNPPPGQPVSFGGVTMSAPLGWKVVQNQSYVDIQEPSDSSRWLRLNVTTEGNARNALTYADGNTLPGRVCEPGSYKKIDLIDIDLAGAKGAQLEFTCTVNGKPKHGIWRIAVINGKARHVYLQTLESTYQSDKAFFDAAVASYKVA